MKKLISISDLDVDKGNNADCVVRFSEIIKLYDQWKAANRESYSFSVEERYGDRGGGLHASEMSDCTRKIAYSYLHTERREGDIDARLRRIFSVGTTLHAMLQKELLLMCQWANCKNLLDMHTISFKSEVKISKELGGVAEELDINSSCDGVFTLFSPDEDPILRVGLEIKSMSAAEFEKLNKPIAKHQEQTCLYQAALDLPLMWTMYYNKSNSNYTHPYPPFIFQFDSELWNTKLMPRAIKAQVAASSNSLPDRDEGKHCTLCPYSYACQPRMLKGGNGSIKDPGALRLK